MLELEFEPQCASTFYTGPIFSKKGTFLYYYPDILFKVIPKHAAFYFTEALTLFLLS